MRKLSIGVLMLALLINIGLFSNIGFANSDWQYEFTPSLGNVGDIVDLQLTIRTADGKPVNNAVVTWTSDTGLGFFTELNAQGEWDKRSAKVTVDSAYDHVNSGLYSRKVKLAQAGHIRIKVYNRFGEELIDTSTWIGGEEVYTIELQSSLPYALIQHPIEFIVRDQTGALVTNLDVIQVVGHGVSNGISDAKLVDFDGDGKVDGYRVSVMSYSTKKIDIFAATDKGNRYGRLTIKVMPPPISVSPKGKITALYPEAIVLESKLRDSTGELVPFYYRLRGEGVLFSIAGSNYDELAFLQFYQGVGASSSHQLSILAKSVAHGGAPKIAVEVSYNGNDYALAAELPLNIAELLFQNELIAGKNNLLRMKVLNARGEPCSLSVVEVLGSMGMTDEHGEVVLLIAHASQGQYPVKVSTKYGVYVEGVVTVVTEVPSPSWTIQLGVPNPALGLTQPPVLMEGRVMLPFRWFGEEILGAEVGYFIENGKEVITLTRASTHVRLILGEKKANVNGAATNLDVAPLVVSGRTLVPARFLAETFGYIVTWNEQANHVVIEQR